MYNWIKILVAATITLLILISCKSLYSSNGNEYLDTEYNLNTSNFESEGDMDTIPDPDPEEPEIPEEEPDPEEEEPDPIPDTIGIWRMK